MLAALVDHLWQSLLFCALGGNAGGPGTQQSRRRAPVVVAHLRIEIPGAVCAGVRPWASGWVSRWFTAPIRSLNGCARRGRDHAPGLSPAQSGDPVAYRRSSLSCSPDWLATAVCFRLVTGAMRVEFERAAGSLAAGSSRRRMHHRPGVLQGSAVHFLCNLAAVAARCWEGRYPMETGDGTADRKCRARCAMRRWS